MTTDYLEFAVKDKPEILEWHEYAERRIEVMAKKIEKQAALKRKKKKKVAISELINENFYEAWKSKQPNKIFKGGRSSLKSSFISIRLVNDFLKDPKANTICLRKVGLYLRGSVYSQIVWAITKLNKEKEFRYFKSPLCIIHKKTGTGFYFFGADEPQKIKSTKIINGYVRDIWFEEAAELKSHEEIDTIVDTFVRERIRDKDGNEVLVNTYFSYNPPRDEYNWLNLWSQEKVGDPTYYVHESTYLEDKKGFLSRQFIEKVEKVKITDPEYYKWMYLGHVTGIRGKVYNISLFQMIDAIPSDDRIRYIDIATDNGYSNSATTFLLIGYTLKKRVILLDTFYYSPENQRVKKAPSDFTQDYKEFLDKAFATYRKQPDTETTDSADGAFRNQAYKDLGRILKPAKKRAKEDMIEFVRALLAEGRVFVLNTENNKIFIDEHKKYQWDEKTLEPGRTKNVVKVDDHTCDAFQYYVMNNLDKLGFK